MLVGQRPVANARKRLEPGFGLLASDLSLVREPIETSDLPFSLDSCGMPGRQMPDQRPDAFPQLKGEVGSRGAHQLANVVDGHLAARAQTARMLGLAHRAGPWELALTGCGSRS